MSSRIKRLKMKGFKSFLNPTVLNFEEGFNTIVGANGSGKSNVFDALCFVLGRMSSKGLRADKLGNLVFNGGKTSKPAKEAEVAIFLSNDNKELLNTDLEEVKISRVVKKSGQSTYYLNNNRATRTEIVEILKNAQIDPDGYNIILQGDITKIVNMTSNERRELIEEIANISNYEEKRQGSIKKLEKVEADLKEADLLLEEKTKYIKELKSEKEAAEKYHKAKEDLRYNSLLLTKSKLIRNKKLKEKKQEEKNKQEETLKYHKDILDKIEIKQKEINTKIDELEKSIEIKSHKNFIEVTNKITSTESEITKLKEKKAELEKQVKEIKSKDIGIKENIKNNKEEIKKYEISNKELNSKKKEIEKELKEIEDKLNKSKKNISSESFNKIDELDKKQDELVEQKYKKNQIKQDNLINIEKLNNKIENLEEERKKQENSNSENKKEIEKLNNYRKELKNLISKISNLSSENTQTAAKINNLEKEYTQKNEELSKLNIKLQNSKNLMASNKAVDTILKFKSNDNNIHGSVAELANVPEKYSQALETVAGKNLFNIVVEDDKTAVKYINYLKENKIGNATFLPLNKVKTKFKLDDNILNKKGVIDYALNLIKYDKKYENIFHLTFQDTIVIDKIENANSIGIGNYKMVTLSSDLVMKSGAMSGGYRTKNKSIGAFKDNNIEKQLSELNENLSSLKSTLDYLKEEKDESEKEIYNLKNNKIEIESEIAKLEKILSIEEKDIKSIKEEIENLISDKSIIDKNIEKTNKEIENIDKELKKVQEEKNKYKIQTKDNNNINNINDLQTTRDNLKEELTKLNSNIQTNNIQITKVLNPEINNLNKIIKDSTKAIENIQKQLKAINEQITKLNQDLKSEKEKEKELSKDYKEFITKRDKLKDERRKEEEKYDKEYTKFDNVKQKIAQLNYAIDEYENMYKSLEEEIEQLYEQIKIEIQSEDENKSDNELQKELTQLLENVNNKLDDNNIDIKELQTKVNNLKNKINSFGAINMKAVEVYDQLKEEFDKLITKRESLNNEKSDILKLIEEMDSKKKEKFLETFNQLQHNFTRVFSLLSTKGNAELLLEDEKNIFENGVDIRVKMTQKNILDIKSLSGGEKTITAIAFIFAVQEFNPASFYIFDEVDAALDIINAEKLGKLINQYSKSAQYIVVSHSEHLIQSAEIIYGVTMNKYKISDVVSLDLRNMKDYVDNEEPKQKISN